MRNSIASKLVGRVEGKPDAVEITFTDGRSVYVDLDELPDGIRLELLAHGLSQKLGDSYASAKGNIDFAYAECSGVAEALMKGEWNRRGAGVGGLLAQAIANLTGKVLADVMTALADMDGDVKTALKKRKDIKAEMAKISAERAAAQVGEGEESDLGDLF